MTNLVFAITTGKYGTNPAGVPSFTPTGDYWFLDVSDRSGLSSVVIRFCPADADNTVYYWDGGKWVPCTDQSYQNGCMQVTVTDTSGPRISDLDQQVFALGRANAAIPTLSEWGMILISLFLATAGMFILRRRRVGSGF